MGLTAKVIESQCGFTTRQGRGASEIRFRLGLVADLFVRLGRLWLLGGDDGSQLRQDPRQYRGFDKRILRYNRELNTWGKAAEMPISCVTVLGLWFGPNSG